MQITVSHYSFTVSEPYQPGQPLSVNDATRLNAARAAYLHRAIAPSVQSAGHILTPLELDAIQDHLTAIDSNFVLPPLPKRIPSALDNELRLCAIEYLHSQGRESYTELHHSSYSSEIMAAMKLPEVRQAAHRNLEAKLSAVDSSLEDFL